MPTSERERCDFSTSSPTVMLFVGSALDHLLYRYYSGECFIVHVTLDSFLSSRNAGCCFVLFSVEKIPCNNNRGRGARWIRSYKRAVANEFIRMGRQRRKGKSVKKLCDKLNADGKKWIKYPRDRHRVCCRHILCSQ